MNHHTHSKMEKQDRVTEDRPFVHSRAEVSPDAHLGSGVKLWDDVKVREGACIGANTIVGKGAYIDRDVSIGANCKIQNGSFIYRKTTLEDGVFVGPHACFANDRIPRAIMPSGRLKDEGDWKPGEIRVCYGASIGAGVTILPNITIGRFAMVGAGAVVVQDVPDHGLVVGVRAHLIGYVCRCGGRLSLTGQHWSCRACGEQMTERLGDFERPKGVPRIGDSLIE